MPDPQADYEIDIDWDEALPTAPLRKAREEKKEPRASLPAKADRDLAGIQRAAARKVSGESGDDVKEGEVTDSADRVTLMDRDFRVSERIGLMPLLKFASASDMDVQDPRALSAMYALLRDCIYEGHPGCGECADCEAGNDTSCKEYERGDWGAFEEHAMITKADAEDLMDVVTKVLEIVSGRPTPPRSGSSGGQRRTRGGSTGELLRRKAQGIEALTPRQLLNVAYATITGPMTEEETVSFEEQIGMRVNPEAVAKEALRAYQEAQGLVFENPDAPVAAPLGSRDEEIPGKWMK